MTMTSQRLAALQSYLDYYRASKKPRAATRVEQHIQRVKANEADWRRRVFGGGR